MNIAEILSMLDPDNDEQWTSDGLPKVAVVRVIAGDDDIQRADIVEAAPEFNRDVALTTQSPDEPEVDDEGRDDVEPEVDNRSLEEKLADELTALQLEMADITKAQATLDEERKVLAKKIGYVGGQLDKERSRAPVQSGIQQYLESQNKMREDKAARIKAFEESGVAEFVKTLGVSKLDAAMRQRKPARGSQRPALRKIPQ